MEHNNQYKSVFLSDIHLRLLTVVQLKSYDALYGLDVNCDNLFLSWEISVDLWAMKDKFYWPSSASKNAPDKFINLKNKGELMYFLLLEITMIP